MERLSEKKKGCREFSLVPRGGGQKTGYLQTTKMLRERREEEESLSLRGSGSGTASSVEKIKHILGRENRRQGTNL